MNMRISTPGPTLKWPGAKWAEAVVGPIVQHFPPHRCYVDLFFGSGGPLFNKAPAACEIVNDLDDDVVNFFEVLRDQTDALAEAVSLTPWSRREWEIARAPAAGLSKLERARRFVARMNQSHGQRPGCTGWRHDGPGRASSFTLQWRAMPERIAAAAERLRGLAEVRRVGEHEHVGAGVPREDVERGPALDLHARQRRRIYRKEMMGAAEHEQLLESLRRHPGPVALTHYRCPLYDAALGDWTLVELAAVAEHGQRRVEGLYLNPELVRRLQVSQRQLDLLRACPEGQEVPR